MMPERGTAANAQWQRTQIAPQITNSAYTAHQQQKQAQFAPTVQTQGGGVRPPMAMQAPAMQAPAMQAPVGIGAYGAAPGQAMRGLSAPIGSGPTPWQLAEQERRRKQQQATM